MNKIRIEHLGTIKYFENDVNEELMVFIGEQVSGKSTIAKTVFSVGASTAICRNFLT